MSLFQKSLLKKHLLDSSNQECNEAYKRFSAYFHDPQRQQNIRNSKEEQFQEGFLRELFGNILGYILNPEPNFNLTTELKNTSNSKKADGAIVINGKALAVIELKGTETTDLGKIEAQAFGYKNNHPECVYVISSNFEKLRFYIDNAIDYEEFNLFKLSREEFNLLYLCLSFESIQKNLPRQLKSESVSQEDVITKKLYRDYSDFKRALYQNMVALNPEYEPLLLFKKTQKLLDRFLFIFFAEDRLLLPTNLIFRINQEWKNLKQMRIPVSLYERYRVYFNDLNMGAKVSLPAFGTKTGDAITAEFDIFAYNGGLFLPDEVLDNIKIDDDLLHQYSEKMSHYDFESDVDVNILGHIFENSLNEIEEIKSEIEGEISDKTKSKRKKDGVFYTPKYITKYIVDNTLGKLCNEQKEAIELRDEDYSPDKKLNNKAKKEMLDKLQHYREWLLQLTICDPACGSGAFLNQALEFLIAEHGYVDELQAKLMGDSLLLSDVENSILENNLYGVDINEESVEIAKLSLWLRTAQKGRKLNSLNNNIKCGNSLIDDPAVAGDKAFSWEKEFPEVFAKGGFDVVIGNPPYGASLTAIDRNYLIRRYISFQKNFDIYSCFFELANEILRQFGYCSYITPVSWQSGDMYYELRKYLNENCILKSAIKLPYNVFKDAYVDTGIYTYLKGKSKLNYNIEVFEYPANFNQLNDLHNTAVFNLISRDTWNASQNLNLVLNSSYYSLFTKLQIDTVSLGEITKSIRGVLPGSESTSDNLCGENVKKFFIGDVYRYEINHLYSFIRFDNSLKEKPNNYDWFTGERILVRRLINRRFRIMATFTNKEFVNKKDLYILKTTHKNYDIMFILSLLNSKLMSFIKTKGSTNAAKDDFGQLTLADIRMLPIKNSDKQIVFSKMSELILQFYTDFQNQSQKLSTYIRSQYQLEKLSTKLSNWYELSFSDFIKELNRAIKAAKGTALTKKDEFEWMELFEENKKKALEIKAQIDQTDKEIDRMVYELYGLTEEEIAIVENS